MKGPSHWRRTRQRQQYRGIWGKADNGLYALAILNARNDEDIDLGETDEKIKRNIDNALDLLQSLKQSLNDPATGSSEELQLLEDTSITNEQLETAYRQLSDAKESLTPPEDNESIRDTLREIESYASHRARK